MSSSAFSESLLSTDKWINFPLAFRSGIGRVRFGNLSIEVPLPGAISFFLSFNEYLLCPRHNEEAIYIERGNGREQSKQRFAV